MSAPDRSMGMGLRRSLSAGPSALPRRVLGALFVTIVLLALGFSALRGRIIELRYRVADVVREERDLEEQRRAAAVRVRELRDPRRLAELATAQGFARPERVVDLEQGPSAR